MRKIDLTDFRVATSETARLINRRIAMSFLRQHPPMSRADLARRSGLQRSTVSAIVDQLIEEGWVTEGAIGRAPRGRRPRFLHLNVERAGIIAVDLRPEVTTVGLAGVDARFIVQTSWPTPRDPAGFIRKLSATVATFRATAPHIVCEGAGVGLPGRMDASGQLVFAPNLGWGRVDLRTQIEAAINMPVIVANAANACALSELWFGRHDNVRHLAAVTVSEGIGVGLLVNRQLVGGGHSMAGEFGHVTIDEQGPRCPCGKRGCWERYASNTAALEFYAASSPKGARPSSFDELLRLADRGDNRAVDALERMADYLGRGLAAIAMGIAPEVIVIVGTVTNAWSRVGPIVEETVRRLTLPQVATRLVASDESMQPRLRGAATLVVQQHFGAPAVA